MIQTKDVINIQNQIRDILINKIETDDIKFNEEVFENPKNLPTFDNCPKSYPLYMNNFLNGETLLENVNFDPIVNDIKRNLMNCKEFNITVSFNEYAIGYYCDVVDIMLYRDIIENNPSVHLIG